MSRSPFITRISKNVLKQENSSPRLGNLLSTPVKPISTTSSAVLSPNPQQCSTQSPTPNFCKNLTETLLKIDSPCREDFLQHVSSHSETVSQLGKGRFGVVVQGLYKGKIAAVKILNLSRESELDRQYRSEANALHLNHPSIISVYKVKKLSTRVLVVMEPWGMANLHQYLFTEDKISCDEKLSYAIQLASALHHCHQRGIIHLDVKPANVMVNSKGQQIKLGDFGNSQNTQHPSQNLNSVGTIAYCAPEILKGEIPSWHCDCFSYGVTLWQIESQENPYKGRSWTTVAYLVVSRGLRPVQEKPELSKFYKIYEKCWKKQRDERPAFEKILQELESIK